MNKKNLELLKQFKEDNWGIPAEIHKPQQAAIKHKKKKKPIQRQAEYDLEWRSDLLKEVRENMEKIPPRTPYTTKNRSRWIEQPSYVQEGAQHPYTGGTPK